jgi:hypothetical protein
MQRGEERGVMDRQPTGKFLGICVLAAVMGGLAGGLAPAHGLALLPQRITFDQPQDAAVGQPVRLSASTDANANLVVSFRSDTPDLCTVTVATVTPVAPGFCVITATQGGDASYASAPDVARAFLAHSGLEPQTITFDQPQDAAVGQPIRLSAATDAEPHENLVVSFRSDTPDACMVLGVTVTSTTAGVCVITASQGGNEHYAAARPARRSFQAHTGASQQTISFVPPKTTALGQSVTLSASTDAKPLAVSFRSDTPDLCTVLDSTVTTIAAGTCEITAFQGGSATYAAALASGSFKVTDHKGGAAQQIVFDPPLGTTVGVPVVLTALSQTLVTQEPGILVTQDPGSPTGLPVSYTSQNRRVCTVSGATVVPRAAGQCVIIAAQPGNARYLPAESIQQEFPVNLAAQTVTFVPPANATIGQPVALTATASSWLAVTYTSSTPGVCTVAGAALTPIAAGSCAVVASQSGDAQYARADSVTGSFPIGKISQTIDFRPLPDVAFGRPVTLFATASSGLPVSYRTSTPGICTVSGGTVTTRAAGACAITASQVGDDRYATAPDAARSFRVERAAQVVTFVPPADATLGQPATLSAVASSVHTAGVSYRTDTPAVCTVSGSIVSPATAGTCTITASQPGNDGYAPAVDLSRSFPVHRSGPGNPVRKDSQAIVFAQPQAAAVAQVVPLSASATSGLAVSFRSDTPSVCTVADAAVTAIAAGTCAVTASQAGDDRFAAARDVQRSFAVHAGQSLGNTGHSKATQTIFFGQLQAAAVGQADPLSASATSGLALSFRSDTPAVCSVSSATVTTTTAGTCTVTASQAGDDHYLPASDKAESFQVKAGHQVQTITFLPPPQPKVGEAVPLTASATSGLLVAFRSDTPRICTVSGSTFTTIAAGTCTVTASQSGSDHYASARDMAQSFDVVPATSGFPGVLTILLAAVVFAASVVRKVRKMRAARRHSDHLPEPQPTISAEPVPGPPALVRVRNTGAGVRHIVRIESSPGATMTRIKENKS